MNFGYFDSFDDSGLLTGWFVTESDKVTASVGDIFAVLQGDAVLAVGRRTIARPDVEARYGTAVAGFSVRVLPTMQLSANSPLSLTLAGSKEPVKTNQMIPTVDLLNGPLNSVERISANSELLQSATSSWLLSEKFLENFELQGYSNDLIALFYFSMKDCWTVAPNEWIDLEYMQTQPGVENFTVTSPLEVLFNKSTNAVTPNCLFDPTYVAARLSGCELEPNLTVGEVLWQWIEQANQGSIVRPSAIVRGRFDASGRFKNGRKAGNEFLGQLGAIVSGQADFSALAHLIPVFDAEWLLTRPLKASENGSTLLRKILRGSTDVAPNPFFHGGASGLENYRNCCERTDSGETVPMSSLNPSLSNGVAPFVSSGEALDVDQLSRQLRKKICWRADRPNKGFVERLFPGIFNYLEKKTGNKDHSLIFKIYLEQLGIPQSLAGLDLSKPPPSFSPEKLARLGANREDQAIKASVIVPTLGRIDLLFNLLVSMANSSISTPIEVIVSDDASSIDVSILNFFFPAVIFMASEENRGFLRNVNTAAKSARGDYFVIANNDMIIHRRALDELIRVLDEHAEAGVVGGLVLSKDGTVQECGGAVWADGTAWNLFRGQPDTTGMPKNVREVDYTSGCWLATRKSTWLALNGFSDELAPAYCEDLDYCLKVRQSGQRVLVNPHSRVTHFEGQTMGTDTSSKSDGKRFQEINQRKILNKWKKVLPSLYAPNGSLSPQFRGYKYLKPIALIYDHYCPEPDRDAGSKTVFEFVAAICKAQAYYPIFVPMNNHYSKYAVQLEQMGVEVIHGDGWERLERLISDRADQIALTVCSRLGVAKHFQWHIERSAGKKLVYIQDVEEIRHATALGVVSDSDASTIYRRHVETWRRTYELFDHVLTCSAAETEHLSQHLSMPVTTISPNRATPEVPATRAGGTCEMLFVGSMNHYPNLTGIEWFVTSVLPSIRQLIPDATLHLVGSGFETCTWLQVPGVVLHGQVSESTLLFLYSMCNLAVAPLLEGAGTKGKVVEALSQGKPCIGTAIAFQGLGDVLDLLPQQLRSNMTGSDDSLAARVVKYCKSQPASAKLLRGCIEQSIGKADPGTTLMRVVAGEA
jgi:GT2 family glycosyltransferase/glycosyltransferase involved in cell wall biosynthesis